MNREELLKKLHNDLITCNIGIDNIKTLIYDFERKAANHERSRVKLTNEVKSYYYIKSKIIRDRQRLYSLIILLFMFSIITGININQLVNILLFSSILSLAAYTVQQLLSIDEINVIKNYPVIEKEEELKMMNRKAIDNLEEKLELESEYISEYQKALEIGANIRFLNDEESIDEKKALYKKYNI